MTSPSQSTAKVVILGKPLAAKAMELAASAGLTVVASNAYLRGQELVEFIADHQPDGVIVRLGEMTAAAMSCAPNLRIIAKHGVGYDTIDIQAAAERGVVVTVATGANAISVAEQAFALILAVARGVAYLDARMRAGHWDKPHFLGAELHGKTLGIIGCGAVGRHLARIGEGFGMDIVVFDPVQLERSGHPGRKAVTIDALIRQSDIVSLSCPLTAETRNMIGRAQLESFKQGAILINTARGGLVDLAALADALKSGPIGGAGLDTFPFEPPELEAELLALPNVVFSPHIGASTVEAGERVGMMAMSQVIAALTDRELDPSCIITATDKRGTLDPVR